MTTILTKIKIQYLKDTSKGLCWAVLALFHYKELTKDEIDLFYKLIEGRLPNKLKYGLTKQRLELLDELINGCLCRI